MIPRDCLLLVLFAVGRWNPYLKRRIHVRAARWAADLEENCVTFRKPGRCP